MSAEGQIVEDLERLVDRKTSDAVSELRASAREAIEVYKRGHFRAAQALAGAALTTGLHGHFARRDFGDLRRELGKLDPDEVGFTMFRTALVLSAARRALRGYSHKKPPENFNRMATAHDLAGRQLSQANALTGLMLLVSFAVEVDELLRIPDAPEHEAEAA